MGAWGSGPFDNDEAGDFVGDLIDAGDWSVAEAALDAEEAGAKDEWLATLELIEKAL